MTMRRPLRPTMMALSLLGRTLGDFSHQQQPVRLGGHRRIRGQEAKLEAKLGKEARVAGVLNGKRVQESRDSKKPSVAESQTMADKLRRSTMGDSMDKLTEVKNAKLKSNPKQLSSIPAFQSLTSLPTRASTGSNLESEEGAWANDEAALDEITSVRGVTNGESNEGRNNTGSFNQGVKNMDTTDESVISASSASLGGERGSMKKGRDKMEPTFLPTTEQTHQPTFFQSVSGSPPPVDWDSDDDEEGTTFVIIGEGDPLGLVHCRTARELKLGRNAFIMDPTSDISHVPDCDGGFTKEDFETHARGTWFKVTGNGDRLTATSCPALLSIYEGDCEDLQCAHTKYNNFGCQAEWRSVNGETYYVLVQNSIFLADDSEDEGGFTLDLTVLVEGEEAPSYDGTDGMFIEESLDEDGTLAPCRNSARLVPVDSEITTDFQFRYSSDDFKPCLHAISPPDTVAVEGAWFTVFGHGEVLRVSSCPFTVSVFDGNCDALVCAIGEHSDALACEFEWKTNGSDVNFILVQSTVAGIVYRGPFNLSIMSVTRESQSPTKAPFGGTEMPTNIPMTPSTSILDTESPTFKRTQPPDVPSSTMIPTDAPETEPPGPAPSLPFVTYSPTFEPGFPSVTESFPPQTTAPTRTPFYIPDTSEPTFMPSPSQEVIPGTLKPTKGDSTLVPSQSPMVVTKYPSDESALTPTVAPSAAPTDDDGDDVLVQECKSSIIHIDPGEEINSKFRFPLSEDFEPCQFRHASSKRKVIRGAWFTTVGETPVLRADACPYQLTVYSGGCDSLTCTVGEYGDKRLCNYEWKAPIDGALSYILVQSTISGLPASGNLSFTLKVTEEEEPVLGAPTIIFPSPTSMPQALTPTSEQTTVLPTFSATAASPTAFPTTSTPVLIPTGAPSSDSESSVTNAPIGGQPEAPTPAPNEPGPGSPTVSEVTDPTPTSIPAPTVTPEELTLSPTNTAPSEQAPTVSPTIIFPSPTSMPQVSTPTSEQATVSPTFSPTAAPPSAFPTTSIPASIPTSAPSNDSEGTVTDAPIGALPEAPTPAPNELGPGPPIVPEITDPTPTLIPAPTVPPEELTLLPTSSAPSMQAPADPPTAITDSTPTSMPQATTPTSEQISASPTVSPVVASPTASGGPGTMTPTVNSGTNLPTMIPLTTVPTDQSSTALSTSLPSNLPPTAPPNEQPTSATTSPTTVLATASPTGMLVTSPPTTTTTTSSPTEAHISESPTFMPMTQPPSISPTSLPPTVAPVTESPTVAPSTLSPTIAPSTSSPTTVPTSTETTTAPVTVSPTGAPSGLSTTVAPVAPTQSPTISSSTFVPTTETPSALSTGNGTTLPPTLLSSTFAPTNPPPTVSPAPTVTVTAPRNDICSGSFPLSTGVPIITSTQGATEEPRGLDTCGTRYIFNATMTRPSIWFDISLRSSNSNSQRMKISACNGTAADTAPVSLTLYQSNNNICDVLICAVTINNVGCALEFDVPQMARVAPLEERQEERQFIFTYKLLVQQTLPVNDTDAGGTFWLSLEPSVVPPNDDCLRAEYIDVGAQVSATALSATPEPAQTTALCDRTNGDLLARVADKDPIPGLWYQMFVGGRVGLLASACGSERSDLVHVTVYTGACNALQCLTDPTASPVSCATPWTATSSESVYFILVQRVLESGTDNGEFELTVDIIF